MQLFSYKNNTLCRASSSKCLSGSGDSYFCAENKRTNWEECERVSALQAPLGNTEARTDHIHLGD
jgi:hypothetical protein